MRYAMFICSVVTITPLTAIAQTLPTDVGNTPNEEYLYG